MARKGKCEWCGGDCPPAARRPRRYCRPLCRQAAYRERKAKALLMPENVTLSRPLRNCQVCGGQSGWLCGVPVRRGGRWRVLQHCRACWRWMQPPQCR